MKMYHRFYHGVTISFDAPPPPRIRGILKANGFTFASGIWTRKKVDGVGNLFAKINAILLEAEQTTESGRQLSA